MPIYEYRCDQGHTFEVMQRMTDAPVETCRTCERPVQRVFHPVAVHFKGSGFYNTDYGKRRRGRGDDAEGGADGAGKEDGAKAEGSSQGKDSGASTSSSDSKAASKDSGSGGSGSQTASGSASSSGGSSSS